MQDAPAIAGQVLRDEPMARHTSFRIGGPADVLVLPDGEADVIATVRWAAANALPLTTLGNGTNVLVSDKGIRGVTLIISRGLNYTRIEGTRILAGCGTPLMKVAVHAARAGLSGMEFAEGIPGTLGGAIYMNAGTLLGEVKDTLQEVRAVRRTGEVIALTPEQLGLEYRHSALEQTRDILLSATFQLQPKDLAAIAATMQELRRRRHGTQPHWDRSAGCVFKNPPNQSAGKLLDAAGAKGMRCGDAIVSDRHANFVVNAGSATAADVVELMRRMQELIQRERDITLQPEVEFVGEWEGGEPGICSQ